MSKSHVGMGHHVCPVCGLKHDEVVLLNRFLRDTLTDNMFMGFALCPEHQKLWDDGYVALVEVSNQPKDFQSAERTGNLAHVRAEAFSRLFDQPAPEKAIAFVEIGVIQKLKEQTALYPKDPT